MGLSNVLYMQEKLSGWGQHSAGAVLADVAGPFVTSQTAYLQSSIYSYIFGKHRNTRMDFCSPRTQACTKQNEQGKCLSHQPTLVNTGGPDASPLYWDDTGLCTCTAVENKCVACWNVKGKWMKPVSRLPLVYPLQGLRQSLDQGGAVGKGLRGFGRSRAYRQRHGRRLLLNPAAQKVLVKRQTTAFCMLLRNCFCDFATQSVAGGGFVCSMWSP